MRLLLFASLAAGLLAATQASSQQAPAPQATAQPAHTLRPLTIDGRAIRWLRENHPEDAACQWDGSLHYTTRLRVHVAADGQPSNITIAASSGSLCMDQRAFAAAQVASYAAATDAAGTPIASDIVVAMEMLSREERERFFAPPKILRNAEAEAGPCRLKVSMDAVVSLVVQLDGTPTDIKIVRSSGDDCLDRQAMKSVARYLFSPAKRNGHPVPTAIQIDVNFQKF